MRSPARRRWATVIAMAALAVQPELALAGVGPRHPLIWSPFGTPFFPIYPYYPYGPMMYPYAPLVPFDFRRERPATPPPPTQAPVPQTPAPIYRPGAYAEPDFYSWPSGVRAGTCDATAIARMAERLNKPLPGAPVDSQPMGGVAIGEMVRAPVRQRMSAADRACVMQALELVPTGGAVGWTGRDGIRFTVVPRRDFTLADGQPCREYTTRAALNERTEEVQDVACRDTYGSWRSEG